MALDPRAERRRVPRGVGVFAGTFVVGLVTLATLSEILLPGLAERRLRNSLSERGSGITVAIEAEPAAKLLLGRADRVRVRVRALRAQSGPAGDLAARAAKVDALDADIGTLVVGRLRLEDASLRKRGDDVTARATVSRRAIQSALPASIKLGAPKVSPDGPAFTATVSFLGRSRRLTVVARARDGRIRLEPDLPLPGFVSLTVFEDPRVFIESVSADGSAVLVRARFV